MIHFFAVATFVIFGVLVYDFFKANVIPDSPEVEPELDISEAFYTDYFDNKN